MEENKQGKFDKIDELLKDTSAENRIKFNSANSGAEKIIAEDSDIKTLFDKPVQDEVQETDAPVRDVDVQPVAEEDEDSGSDPVCIIDETSTTVELTADTGAYQSFSDSASVRKKKAPKEKIKFNALQIVLMCVVGVILLWCVIFTTDHTLAANGRAPIFSWETQKYEDGSASYKGLGYKIQFRFDSGDNLTQKCVPIWKDGPNDIADKQQSGASFQ